MDRVALGEIFLRLLRVSAVNLALTKDKRTKAGRRQNNVLSQIGELDGPTLSVGYRLFALCVVKFFID